MSETPAPPDALAGGTETPLPADPTASEAPTVDDGSSTAPPDWNAGTGVPDIDLEEPRPVLIQEEPRTPGFFEQLGLSLDQAKETLNRVRPKNFAEAGAMLDSGISATADLINETVPDLVSRGVERWIDPTVERLQSIGETIEMHVESVQTDFNQIVDHGRQALDAHQQQAYANKHRLSSAEASDDAAQRAADLRIQARARSAGSFRLVRRVFNSARAAVNNVLAERNESSAIDSLDEARKGSEALADMALGVQSSDATARNQLLSGGERNRAEWAKQIVEQLPPVTRDAGEKIATSIAEAENLRIAALAKAHEQRNHATRLRKTAEEHANYAQRLFAEMGGEEADNTARRLAVQSESWRRQRDAERERRQQELQAARGIISGRFRAVTNRIRSLLGRRNRAPAETQALTRALPQESLQT